MNKIQVLKAGLRGTNGHRIMYDACIFSKYGLKTYIAYSVQPISCDIWCVSVRYASRHNLNFLGEASDWLAGRSSQLGGRKTSFASFQKVEGSKSYNELLCLK